MQKLMGILPNMVVMLGLAAGAVAEFDAASEITVVSREEGSGTRGAFVELLGVEKKDADGNKVDYTTEEAIITNNTNVMMTTVAGNEVAIGYSSMGSLNEAVKALRVNGVYGILPMILGSLYVTAGALLLGAPIAILAPDDRRAVFRAEQEAGTMSRLKNAWRHCCRYPGSALLHLLCAAAMTTVICTLLLVVGYILITGAPELKWSLFFLDYNSDNVSLMPALVNTLIMTYLSLFIAAPLGIGGAIFLAEYADRSSWLVKAVRLTAETLSGIPSILYGLFGSMCFVVTLRWSYSLLAGGMTLAIMILPLILRTTEEALLSIPDSYREGSFGLGAGRLRTVMKIVLPPAGSGILAGVILAVGKVVGETAALIYTADTVGSLPDGLMSSGRTLAVHMYVLSGEGLHVKEASATAVVLIVIVTAMNALSAAVAKKLTKG